MLGKVFCLYLVLLLFVITVFFYVLLSGMNNKTFDIWREITLGLICLSHSVTLFHFCNYAHYFTNSVRYRKILFEHIYIYIYIYTIMPPSRM
jgi:high-affinity Fe2+/Pb2+ permease